MLEDDMLGNASTLSPAAAPRVKVILPIASRHGGDGDETTDITTASPQAGAPPPSVVGAAWAAWAAPHIHSINACASNWYLDECETHIMSETKYAAT